MTIFRFSAVLILATMLSIKVVAQAAGTDTQPSIVGNVTYTMPQAVADAHIGGKVTVAIVVDDKGTVEKAWLAAGPVWPCFEHPDKAIKQLSDSLTETVKQIKFRPATKNGNPVKAEIGLELALTNPKLIPPPVEIDPVTRKPKPSSVNVGVLNGKALRMPPPRFPASAKANKHGGAVPVQVWIDEKGNVTHAGALSGYSTLQGASRDAACQAKFAPALLQGNPVRVIGTLTYNFVP